MSADNGKTDNPAVSARPRRLFLILLFLSCSLALTGCTNTFGVQPEVWKTLDDKQKNKIIDEYYAKQREERKIREKKYAARKLREQRLLKSLDKDAYFPDRVLYGKIFGGKFRSGDDYHHFRPVHFSIAYGEIKPLQLHLTNGKTIKVYIEYANGSLLFDVSLRDLNRERAVEFPVDSKTRQGVHFSAFDTSNHSPLDGVNLNLNLRLIENTDKNR